MHMESLSYLERGALVLGHAREEFEKLPVYDERKIERTFKAAQKAFIAGSGRKRSTKTATALAKCVSPYFPKRPFLWDWKPYPFLAYRGHFYLADVEIEHADGATSFREDCAITSELRFYRDHKRNYSAYFETGTICRHAIQRAVERKAFKMSEIPKQLPLILARLSAIGRTHFFIDDLREQRAAYLIPWENGAFACCRTRIFLPRNETWRWVTSIRTFLSLEDLNHEQRSRVAALWDAPWDLGENTLNAWEFETWERAMKANARFISNRNFWGHATDIT